MQDDLLQGFYLGDLLVEPLNGQVTGRTHSAHLPPKAAEVLLCLARRAGEVVERDTLLTRVWGEGRGNAEALTRAIGEIRHALDDHPVDPQFIQTLPRRGYRLIVDPVPAGKSAAAAAASPPTSDAGARLPLFEALKRRGVIETAVAYMVTGWLLIQIADVVFDQLFLPRWAGTFVTILVIAGFPLAVLLSWFIELRDGRAVLDTRPDELTPARRLSRTYLSIVSAMVLASIGVFLYDRTIGLPTDTATMAAIATPEPPPVRENSIAVLPFFNIDGSEQTDVFAFGLAEDVINRLASIPGLAVASRGDSWTLPPNARSSEVRERLRVALYLEGSVRIVNDVLRVVVQLIDSETGFHIVSRDFEGPLENFHDVQQEITDLTVANLRVALPSDTQPALDSAFDSSDVDAYVLYRRGREKFQQVRTVESLDETIDYYRQALQIDPLYAAAHAGICEAYVNRFEIGGDVADIRSAESACAAALQSNPRLYMVYDALGVLYRRTGRWDDAEQAFEKALSINAQDVDAKIGLASVYRMQQKFAQAQKLFEEAIAIQPGNWRIIDSLGGFLFRQGRYAEAAKAFSDVAFLNPSNSQVLGNLGSSLMMAGDFEAARVALEQALEIRFDGRFQSNLGVIYYYLGEFEKSVDTHRAAVEQNPETTILWLNLADALHFANEPERARDAFDTAATLAERGLAINPTSSELLTSLAWARQMLGHPDDAEAIIERNFAVAPDDPYSHYYKGLIETRHGELDAALESLDRAVELGYPLVMLAAEPYLEPLRGRAEFQDLVGSSK